MISFSLDQCKDIIDLTHKLPVTNRDESPRPISYQFCSIPHDEKYKWIFNTFNSFLEITFGVKVIKDLDTIHLFNYSIGDKFGKHRDIYYPGQVYNVGVNLNDDYEGGDFILHEPYTVVKKEAGKLYTFKNTIPHEVTEVTKGNRYSLIGFYFYDNLNINQAVL